MPRRTPTKDRLSVRSIRTSGGRNLGLPFVAVGKQLLLVVEELLTGLSGVFGVGSYKKNLLDQPEISPVDSKLTLNDRIHRTALLAVTTVDALGHVDIVTGCPAASILALFCFNGDSLRWADGLAELASNAALLTGGIPTQSVLTAETGRDGALLEGVENGVSATEKDGLSVYRNTIEVEKWRVPCRQRRGGRLTVGGNTAPARRTCHGRARP